MGDVETVSEKTTQFSFFILAKKDITIIKKNTGITFGDCSGTLTYSFISKQHAAAPRNSQT